MSQGDIEKPADDARIATGEGLDKKQRRPFAGRHCLYNIVRVRLGESPFDEPYDAGELFLLPDDRVIADTAKGPMLGVATSVVERLLMERGRIRRIIRRGTDADISQHQRNIEKAHEAFNFCLKRIQARNLDMKLCRAEYMLDRSRLLYFFSAEHRIDFRQLVRDLARQYGTRIEMRQIGVRDGAGLIGGIGHCGKELCCCSFLRDHSSISIRHAKDQGITLNPKKVSGMCGRLMCCLVYEHETYLKARSGAPRVNRAVDTEKGQGVITEVDILQRKVRVVLESGGTETFSFDEVRVDNETIRRPQDIKQYATTRQRRPSAVVPTESHPEEDYQWEGNEPDRSVEDMVASSEISDGSPDDAPSRPQIHDSREAGDRTSDDEGSEMPETHEKPHQPRSPDLQRHTPGTPRADRPSSSTGRPMEPSRDRRSNRRRRPGGPDARPGQPSERSESSRRPGERHGTPPRQPSEPQSEPGQSRPRQPSEPQSEPGQSRPRQSSEPQARSGQGRPRQPSEPQAQSGQGRPRQPSEPQAQPGQGRPRQPSEQQAQPSETSQTPAEGSRRRRRFRPNRNRGNKTEG